MIFARDGIVLMNINDGWVKSFVIVIFARGKMFLTKNGNVWI
jgi:hypothetical protein